MKKTYIPSTPRSRKLKSVGGGTINVSGGSAQSVPVIEGHTHDNKIILDAITQLHLRILSSLNVDENGALIVELSNIIKELDATVPTDENLFSALRTVLEIRARSISKTDPDTAQEIITFLKGIIASGTSKFDNIEVGDYTTGPLGAGAAIKMENGVSRLEVDNLDVRMRATFRELIIESLKHIGGQLILSPARMKCNKVVDGGTYYRCYFDTGDGKVSNEFVAGDQARCQVFTGSGVKMYWRLVTSVGTDWINLSKTDAISGSSIPEAGDDIVQLGNRTDTTRQNAQILSTVGPDAPSWKQYKGINAFSLEGKDTTVFSGTGNKIDGKTVFVSSGSNIDDWANEAAQDIEDAQAAANAAALAAQQAIDDAAANVGLINTEVGKLQAQIDGEVSNWFYPYSPTLANYPASDWTTNTIKDRHIGDTFTNTAQAPATDAGKSWRFVKNGTVYSWTQISDSDAVLALQKAAQAQSTADGKSTTFLIQPTSYKFGDMWVLAADQTVNGIAYKSGEILTATQDSTTYNQAHWVKKVRYTDDTAVNNLQIGDVNLARYSGTGYYLSSAGTLLGIYSEDRSKSYVVTESGVSAIQVQGGGLLRIAGVTGLTAGKTYTWRIMIKGTTDLTGIFQHYAGSGYGSTNVTITEDWAVYTNTFVCQGTYEILHIYSLSDTFYIADWMLVEGNKVTEGWSANILDVEGKINDAKQEALTAAGNAQTTANAANTAVGSLNTYVDGAFKDGVIDAAEAKAIEKYKNTLNETMSKAEASYNKVYANTYLEGAAKTNLLNAKINLWWQRDTLLSAINTAIAGGTTTPAQKTAVDNAFSTFNNLMSAFQNALEEANKAIQTKLDNIAKGYVDGLQIGGRNLFITNNFSVVDGYNVISDKKNNASIGGSNFLSKLEAGKTYTLFCKVRIKEKAAGVVGRNWFRIFVQGGTTFIDVTGSLFDSMDAGNTIEYRNVFTFSAGSESFIRAYNSSHGGIYDVIELIEVKVVEGNVDKKGDWTPAPEDVQGRIDAEKNRINDILSDNVADPSEKQYLSNLWQEIYAEYPRIWAQANTYAVDKSNYEAKYTALNNLLSPVLANLTTNSTVSGASIRTAFSQYYDAKTFLLNNITNKVNTTASDAQAKANVSKAVTDKFSGFDGGLATAVIMEMREPSTTTRGDATAGISGIQKDINENFLPAVWAGGTYAQAIAGTAKAIIKHNGKSKLSDTEITGVINALSGKVGVLTIEESGRVVLTDPDTHAVRLVFSESDIPLIADLVSGANDGGSASNAAQSNITVGYLLPNAITVGKNNSSIAFSASTFTVNANIANMMDYITVNVYLRKNGVNFTTIKSVQLYGPGAKSENTSITYGVDGVGTGTYDVFIEITKTNALDTVTSYISASTLSWTYTQAGIRYFQFGVNGMMAFFSDNHWYFTETGGFDLRGATNMPGVLAKGRVLSGAARDANYAWGAKYSTAGVTKISTGGYRVPVSCPDACYSVFISPRAASRSYYLGTQTSTYFEVYFTNLSGAAVDTEFDFTVVGKNY